MGNARFGAYDDHASEPWAWLVDVYAFRLETLWLCWFKLLSYRDPFLLLTRDPVLYYQEKHSRKSFKLIVRAMGIAVSTWCVTMKHVV